MRGCNDSRFNVPSLYRHFLREFMLCRMLGRHQKAQLFSGGFKLDLKGRKQRLKIGDIASQHPKENNKLQFQSKMKVLSKKINE